MEKSPGDIASRTARARRDLYGLLVVAGFLGFYGGMGAIGRTRGEPSLFVMIAIGMVVLALGIPGLLRGVRRDVAATLDRARAAADAGDVEEAGRLLDELEAAPPISWAAPRIAWLRPGIAVARARMAVRAGKLKYAAACLGFAIGQEPGLIEGERFRRTHVEARSLRALVRAAMDDDEGARADIGEVRRRKGADAEALARAGLAEAIRLERRGDRAGLKALLEREGELLFKHTRGRERSLVGALDRMLHASEGGSVYRQRAPGSASPAPPDDPELTAWVAQIAKDAVPFVQAVETDGPRKESARPKAKKKKKKRPAPTRIRVAVEPERVEPEARAGLEEARAELEAEEALAEEARRRAEPRDT